MNTYELVMPGTPAGVPGQAPVNPCEDGQPTSITCTGWLGTFSVPFQLFRVMFDQGGPHIGPVLTIGAGFTVIHSRVVYAADGTGTIDPGILAGVAVEGGITPQTSSSSMMTTSSSSSVSGQFSVSGFLGYRYYAGSVGYDFNSKAWFLGVSSRFDTFQFLPDSYFKIGDFHQ